MIKYNLPTHALTHGPTHCSGALNDFQKDKQFRKLNDIKDTIEIKTLRGGQMQMVTNHDLVVGDVVILDAGDKVVADMIMFESHGLIIDEASLTGESDPIKKQLDSDPWIRSGTQVCREMENQISLKECLNCPHACLGEGEDLFISAHHFSD